DGGSRHDRRQVPLNELPQPVSWAWRHSRYRIIVQKTTNVGGQPVRSFITARSVLLERLHNDPVQIAPDQHSQLFWVCVTLLREHDKFLALRHAHPRGGLRRLYLADDPADLLKTGAQQGPAVKWSLPRQQFVKQHPKRVNVAACVDIDLTQPGLFRAH